MGHLHRARAVKVQQTKLARWLALPLTAVLIAAGICVWKIPSAEPYKVILTILLGLALLFCLVPENLYFLTPRYLRERKDEIEALIATFEKELCGYISEMAAWQKAALFRRRADSYGFGEALERLEQTLDEAALLNKRLFCELDLREYSAYAHNRRIDLGRPSQPKQPRVATEGQRALDESRSATPMSDLITPVNSHSDLKRVQDSKTHPGPSGESQRLSEIARHFSIIPQGPRNSFSSPTPPHAEASPKTRHDVEETNTPGRATAQLPAQERFRAVRRTDWSHLGEARQLIGLTGEQLVVALERDYLNALECWALAARVRHVAQDDGDGLGYDVLSFFPDGAEKYIEVKTTTKTPNAPFYMSKNELAFIGDNRDRASVYRVYLPHGEEVPRVQVLCPEQVLEADITAVQFQVRLTG